MRTLFARLKNEPARVGALILIVVNFLIARGVLEMSVAEVGWLNVAMAILFGEGVRQMVYGPQTGADLKGELLDQ